MKTKRPWYQTFFEDYRPFFANYPEKDTRAQIPYIVKKLGLKKGSRFLDCPCGIGRISIPLAEQGIRVTGVDITYSYLEELAHDSERRGLKINLVESDMRRIRFEDHFDGAANLGTSFGYFEKESDNLLALKAIYRALRPGGRFILQVTNRDWIITHYCSRGWAESGSVIALESREFNYATSMIKSEWRIMRDGQIRSHRVDLRVYSYHELMTMFTAAGFTDVGGSGGVDDEPISSEHMYMWAIGTKPGRKRA